MTRQLTCDPTLPRRRTLSNSERALISDLYRYTRKTAAGKAVLEARIGLSRTQMYHASSRAKATNGDAFELTFDAQARWKLRDDPEHTVFTDVEDDAIRCLWPAAENTKSLRIEALAVLLDKTETAVAYHARQLGLRNVAQFYELERVRVWLDLSYPTARKPNEVDELALLDKFSYGLLHPCTDLDGNVLCTLVSTAALARLFVEAELPVSDNDDRYARLRKQFMRKLLAERWPDQFFIKELVEGIEAVGQGEAVFEPNPWISHGMTDLHPLSAGRGTFLFGPHDAARDDDEPFALEKIGFLYGALRPQDMHPDERLDADGWRHPFFGRDSYTLGRDPAEALGLSLADLDGLAA